MLFTMPVFNNRGKCAIDKSVNVELGISILRCTQRVNNRFMVDASATNDRGVGVRNPHALELRYQIAVVPFGWCCCLHDVLV